MWMYNNRYQLIALVSVSFVSFGDAFVAPNPGQIHPTRCYAVSNKLTTLTEETTWKLQFVLNGLPTEQGKKVDEFFSIQVHFKEEEGYEPPQGDLIQIGSQSFDEENKEDSEAYRLQVVKSRWILSEDPNERKDGLWVWGLFKEPLYPFLLLQLETDRVPLPGSSDDAIKPLKLFAQLNHAREEGTGVILKGGDLKVREMETINADPFGAASVDIYEEVSIGKISVEPIKTVKGE